MSQQKQSASPAHQMRSPTPDQWKALHLLSHAWLAARAEAQDVWQFAVEIDQVRALGLSHTELRRLLCWGYLEHARERTRAGSSQRLFHRLRTLVLPKRT